MLKKRLLPIIVLVIGILFNIKNVFAKTYQDANIEFNYPDWNENSYGQSSLPEDLKNSLRASVKNDMCSFQVFEGYINDNSKFKELTEKNITDQIKTLNGEIVYQNIQDKTFEIQIVFKIKPANSTTEESYTEYVYGVLTDNGNIYNINYTSKSSNFETGCKNDALNTVASIKIKDISANNIEKISEDVKKEMDKIIKRPFGLTWNDFKDSVKLAFTFDQAKKSELELKFAEEKINIINALSASGYSNVQDIIDKLNKKVEKYLGNVSKMLEKKTITEEKKKEIKESVEKIKNNVFKK